MKLYLLLGLLGFGAIAAVAAVALVRWLRARRRRVRKPARPRHPVVLPKAVFERLKDSREETLKQFLQNNASAVALREMDDPGLDFDLDTPADYEKALWLFAGDAG